MKQRVLLLDDQPELRLLLRMLLEVEGHEIIGEAGTLSEALSQAGALQPSVVVLDQRLPDGLGSGIVSDLRALCSDVRIYLYAGEPAEQEIATAAGADGFVRKGDPLSQLRQLLAS